MTEVRTTSFEKILNNSAFNINSRTKDSSKWYQQQAKKLKVTSTSLLREDADRLKNTLAIGEMGFFLYDPKHKNILPYYDSFPLVIKIDNTPDGMLGLNLHYLPLPLRAKLMDALHSLVSNKKYDEKTRLKISYEILKSASKFAPFKPCIKRYLRAHYRSRFIKIHSYEWDIALFLPVQQFQKASAAQVWRDSRTRI